jgi:hypothetical protein
MRSSRVIGIACVGVMMLTGTPRLAQPAPATQPTASTPDAALTDKARELYIEGQKAGTKKKWGEAYANLLAAWSLKRHWQIAGVLGWVEVELGKYRDAAEHLAHYLREAPKDKVKERQSAEVLLVEARKRVGALQLKVEPAGAEVVVDGQILGKAPLSTEVFVDPGTKVIEARRDGYAPAKRTIEATAGAPTQMVAMSLVKQDASTVLAGSSATHGGRSSDTKSAAGASARSEAGVKNQGSDEGGPSKGLIIAGIASSVVAIGAGTAFAIVSTGHGTDADDRLQALRQKGGSKPCSVPALAAECTDVVDALAARDRFGNLALWGFLVGGVLGAGTAVYALATPRQKLPATVRAIPVADTHSGGILMVGNW